MIRFLTFVILLIAAFQGQAQVTIVPVVSKDDVSINETFKLTFIVEVKGNITNESRLFLPDFSKFQIVGSASNRNTVVNGDDVVDQKVYQWVLKPLAEGTIKIGSAKVNVNGKDYHTEPFNIKVKPNSIAQNNQPKVEKIQPYLKIELKKNRAYTNQPIAGEVKVYATTIKDLNKVKNIHLDNKSNNAIIEEVSYRRYPVDVIKTNLLSQTVAEFIVVPTTKGNVILPSATASINPNTVIKSTPVKLSVLAYPKNKSENFYNAVGESFEVSILNQNKGPIVVNKPIKVLIQFKGNGNLNNVNPPLLKKIDGYDVFPPKINRRYKKVENTLRGEVSAEYIVIPRKTGNVELTIEDYAYFKPSNEQYTNLKNPKIKLSSVPEEKLNPVQTTYEKVNIYTNNVLSSVDNPVVDTGQLMTSPKKEFPWKIIVLNIVLLAGCILLFIYFKKWQKKRTKFNNSITKKSLGSIEESEEEIKKLFNFSLEEEFHYLKSLVDSGKYSEFFKSLEELRLNFIKTHQIADFQSYIEDSSGLETSTFYQDLQHRVEVEKFKPSIDSNAIEKIYYDYVKFYTEISK